MNFEITAKDVMGRIGKLKTPHGVVETPALMPVINPNLKFIPVKEMKRMGAQIAITNSYIIYRNENLKERAIEKGVHGLIESDLPVMTDSGSYQLMVYGDVEIDNTSIVEFQNQIRSDIVVPLDIPTPPDTSKSEAEKDLKETLEREREATELHAKIGGERLIAAPIQGAIYPDLRRFSAKKAAELKADFYPIGGVVPLLDSYRFPEVVRIILEVKSELPPSAPVHLFGAGHPMVFAMAVALGCDFFDSAAYALYAKDDRYLTVHGTKKLDELQYFPCSCPVCNEFTPEKLRKVPKDERQLLLGKHNLHVSFEEINVIKQAIKEKTLFDLVESRIRGHPYLVSAWRVIKEYRDLIELYDPSAKQGFFYTGIESIYRPAVQRHHRKILNLFLDEKRYVISAKPVLESNQTVHADFYLLPVFGVVVGEFYPGGHAELPEEEYIEEEALEEGFNCLLNFLRENADKSFELRLTKRWVDFIKSKGLKPKLPENAEIVEIVEIEGSSRIIER
ncbi:tRNA guanosine(15) transglycosylase TgtA [Archaeoglobales archaeon]|nr:MAG: tRNA guanosine(15) transglycosylase TgtA [Archaeoglobales archaeon]